MIEQESNLSSFPLRPPTYESEGWHDYWRAQGFLWRTEPEIDDERKAFLTSRLSVKPDVRQGIYAFRDIRLNRADVEWLLVTHQNGRGPVDWYDLSQRLRSGLDLRGADLIGVDLSGLPLARMQGGLTETERVDTTSKQRQIAVVHLEGASLFDANLEGAYLAGAKLEGSNLSRAHLEQASLMYAHLEGARLRTTHLEGAFLGFAHLGGKRMEKHELHQVRLWQADFPELLIPANLRHVFFDRATNLDSIYLGDEVYGFTSVVDVNWGDVNLAMVNWEKIPMIGDEYKLRQRKLYKGPVHESTELLRDYRRAARANRQLSIALQNQGLNEEAARFAYRAQILFRYLYLLRKKYGQYLFSLFLYFLAGYGYRLVNSLLAYVIVVGVFAAAYYFLGPTVRLPLSPIEAIVFSITSFHGRGFSPSQNIGLSNPLTILAALEAFVGLIIEITLIATLTQRFFKR